MQQTLNPGKGGANTTLEIIRDNVSFNDTLLEAFIKHYNKEGMKFQGDIPYIAYILNLVIQDILKALIKNDYNTSYTTNIYKQEKEQIEEETEKEEVEQVRSKSFYNLI
jgi:hypothetical protein